MVLMTSQLCRHTYDMIIFGINFLRFSKMCYLSEWFVSKITKLYVLICVKKYTEKTMHSFSGHCAYIITGSSAVAVIADRTAYDVRYS